jgi:L-fucose isomerase
MNNPKIGIRPTIDGRRKGVRESLEVQTMNMAKAAVQRNKLNNIVPRADT